MWQARLSDNAMPSTSQPVMILIGGINGAGKTTLYYNQIKPWLDRKGIAIPFVNADELEKTNFPNAIGQHSVEMAKLAAQIRAEYLQTGQSFVTETVFSHESKNQLITYAQQAGFKVILNHVHVAVPDLAFLRVQTRVTRGGHAVAKEKVFTRFERTLKHITAAAFAAELTFVWDNSSSRALSALKFHFVMSLAKGNITRLADRVPEWAARVYQQPIAAYRKKLK